MRAITRSLLTAALLLLAGCASRPPRGTPSVAPVREDVKAAARSNEKARVSVKAAAASIDTGVTIADDLAARAPVAEKGEFVKLQVALSDAQKQLAGTEDQLTATASTLGDTLIRADALEKQVNAQAADLAAMAGKVAADEKQIAVLTAANKRLSHEVWIYKGGFIVAVLLGLGYLLFSLGVITRLVGVALAVVMPWGYVILAAAAVSVPALLFALLWRVLP